MIENQKTKNERNQKLEQSKVKVQTTRVEIMVKTQITFQEYLLTREIKKSLMIKRVRATSHFEIQRNQTNLILIKKNQQW